ncbi:MAG: PQQ-like beta-propeller repeat protein [Planctomycetaceae bacterium]|nr:PQQ-like beta-propeller repeat protein [Planctomycetaceae bacterium]
MFVTRGSQKVESAFGAVLWFFLYCVRINGLGLIVLSCFGVSFGQDSDWPQWRGPNRDGVWNGQVATTPPPANGLEVLWKSPIGPGYTGPTVKDGRVYVMDRIRRPEQEERVVCLDAANGKQLWEHRYSCVYSGVGYEAGPRASVTIDNDRVFSVGSMGHLHCLGTDGVVIWKQDLNQTYGISRNDRMPIWGIAASPLVYKNLVIVQIGAGNGAGLVAFDKITGAEVWKCLDDRAQYSSPIIVQQAGRDVLVIWTGDSVAGVDPNSGQVFWQHPFAPRNMPIGVASPVYRNGQIFVTSFYDGSMMLHLSDSSLSVELAWARVGESERKTDALHSIIGTPVWIGDHLYGPDSHGEFRCLSIKNGDRIWEDLTIVPQARWATVHIVQFPNAESSEVLLFNERGELIRGELSPAGFKEQWRSAILKPTTPQLNQRGGVCWSHPALTSDGIIVRSDEEIVYLKLPQ